jgi:hypothetical protein
MWIIHRNALSDEKQEPIQQLENRFRSDGMAYSILINKSMEFSQSLLGVRVGGDIVWQKTNITQVAMRHEVAYFDCSAEIPSLCLNPALRVGPSYLFDI